MSAGAVGLMRRLARSVVGMLLVAPALVGAPADPLSALPALTPSVVAPMAAIPGAEQRLGDGISLIAGAAVMLDGRLWIDDGPEEGLAIIASMPLGRLHETLVRLDNGSAFMAKAAFIAAFDWADGATADPLHGYPARGVPVRVSIVWHDDDGREVGVDASCLVRDRTTGRPFPPLPFIYTGSRIAESIYAGTDGVPHHRRSFMLEEHQTVIAAFDEDDALLSTPFPDIADDVRLEVNTRLVPPERTRVRVICRPAALPLSMAMTVDGGLAASPGGAAMDDAALKELLKQRCAALPADALRAVAVRVPAEMDRAADRAVCERILAVAATAGIWVVPVMEVMK